MKGLPSNSHTIDPVSEVSSMESGCRSFLILSSLLIAFICVTPASAQSGRVLDGTTATGAHYLIGAPSGWDGGRLVIWNHAFSLSPIEPSLARPDAMTEVLALLRGDAVASSSYSQPGWALFKTNQDLEQMVRVFEDEFGVPSEVILVGAGLGGLVIVSALEKADLGNVTGALTLCGAVAGSRNWDGALDLRLLYDTICTKKKVRIPGGPKGLEKKSEWKPAGVKRAVRKCFGTPGKRKKKQQKKLDRLVELARIPEEFIELNMWYVTFGMADLVYDRKKMGGKQGAGNENVDYGDEAVNEDIERFSPKESRAKRLGKFYTPNGDVGDVKILSLHTDKDGFVFVENESELASVVPPDQLTIGVVV